MIVTIQRQASSDSACPALDPPNVKCSAINRGLKAGFADEFTHISQNNA
jgi:hypothetical protein